MDGGFSMFQQRSSWASPASRPQTGATTLAAHGKNFPFPFYRWILEVQVETSPAQRISKPSFFVGTEDNKRDGAGRHPPSLGIVICQALSTSSSKALAAIETRF